MRPKPTLLIQEESSPAVPLGRTPCLRHQPVLALVLPLGSVILAGSPSQRQANQVSLLPSDACLPFSVACIQKDLILILNPSLISAMDMPDVPSDKLPEHMELQRTRVVCKSDAPIHTDGIHCSGACAAMGVDNSLQLDSFCKDFKLVVNKLTKDEMEFDMIGIDAALTNAFRRILIAEVPTMAIDKVLFANNTSVVADEVLAHRLGLVPLKADPRLFVYLSENDVPNELNTIVFKLDVSCPKGGPRRTAKSDQLKWLPDGSELLMASHNPSAKPKTFTSSSCSQSSLPELSKNPPAVKHGDIILSKLGPGQGIELEAHATKDIGKTHAKCSHVATAWYRMLTEVVFLIEIKMKMRRSLLQNVQSKYLILRILEKRIRYDLRMIDGQHVLVVAPSTRRASPSLWPAGPCHSWLTT